MKADRIIRDLNHSSKKRCFHKTVFAQQMLILKAHAVISAASGLITFTFPEGGQQQTRLFLILKSCSTYLLTHCNLYSVILTVWQLADSFSLLRLQWPSLFCIYSNTHLLPKTHNTLSYPALITRRRTQWRTLNVLCLMVLLPRTREFGKSYIRKPNVHSNGVFPKRSMSSLLFYH